MAKAPNYTAEMEARLAAIADEHGELNLEILTKVAGEPMFAEKTPRALVAKARSMNLPYAKKVRTDKAGEPVVQKADLAQRVAELLFVNPSVFESLAKAEKPALKALVTALEGVTENA